MIPAFSFSSLSPENALHGCLGSFLLYLRFLHIASLIQDWLLVMEIWFYLLALVGH